MTWREQTYRRRAHEQRMMPSDAPGRDVHSGPGPPGFQTHEFYGGMMLGNQNQEPACFQQKDWNHLSQSAWYQYYPSNQSYFYQQQGQYQRHCQVYSSVSESSTNNRPCSTYSSGYGSSISSEEMLTSPSSSSGSCQLQETSDPRTPVAPPIRNTSSSNGEQTGSFQNKRNHNDECEDSASLCSFGKLDSGIGSVDDPSSVLSNGSFASSATKARSSSRCESVRSETADSTCSSLSSLEGNGPATSTPFSSASVNSFSMNGMCGTSTLSADNHSQQSTPYMVPPPSVDGSCSNPASQMSCFDDLEEGGSTTDPGFNSYGNGSASVLVVSSASGVVSERFGGMSVMASGSGEKSAGEGGATSGSAYGHPESSGGTPDSHVRKSGAQDVTLSSPIRVPHRWKREVNHSAVIYTSPSNIKLKSLKEVTNYLLSDGTCKCGLTCPLNVEQVFNFDPKRPSRPTLLADVAGHPKMCGHRRRLLRDLSALPQIVAQQRQIREQQLSQAAAATASPAAAEETTLPVPPSTQSKGARAGTTKSKEPKKPRTSKKNSAQAAVQQDGGCQQRSSSLPDIARGSPSWSSQGSWGAQRPSSMPYPGYHNASAQAYQRYPYPGAPSATGYPYPHPGYHYPYGGTNGSAHGHVGYPGMSHHHHHHYGDSSSTAAAAMMSYNAHSHGYPHHPYASGSTAPHPPYHPNAFYPRMPAPSPQDPCSGASSARSLHSRRSAGAGVTAAAAYQAGYMPHHLPPSEESHSPYPGMMAMGMYPNRTSTPASVTEKRLGAASGSSNLHRPSCPTPPQPPSSSSMSFNPSHVLPPTSSSSSSTASSSFPPHPLPLPQPATKRKQPSTVAGVTPTVKKKRKKLKYSGLLANVNGTLHPLNPSIPVIPPSPAVPQPTVSSSVNVNPKKSQVVSEPSPTSSTTSTTTATSSKPSTTTSTTHPATSNPSLPSNGPSFMDDPSGYLQHQTALLNKTLSQQPSMAEEASGGPTEESKKINAVQRPRRPPSPEDKASKEVAQQCSPSGSDDDCRSASPCSKSMEDLTAVSTSQTTTTTMTASSSSPSATFSAADSSSATVGAPQSSPSTPLPPLSIPPSPAEPTPSPEMEDDLGTTTVIPEVSEEQMETRSEEDKTIDEEPEQTNVQMAPSPRPLLAEDVTVSSPTSSCPTSSEESTTTTTAIASSSAHQKLRSVRRRTSSGIGQTQEPTVHSTQSDSPPQSLRIDEEEGSGGGGLGKMTSDLASSGTPLFEMSTGDDDECDGVPVLSIPSPPAAMADSTSTLEDPGELLLRCMTTTSSESTTSSNEITTTSQLSRPTTPEKEVMEKEIEDEEEELRKQTIIEEEEVYGKDEEQKGSRTKVGFEETSQEQMQMEVQIEEEQSQENPVIQTPRPEVPVKKQRTKAVDGGTSQETGHSGINTPVKKHSSTAVTTSTTSSSSTSKRSKSSTTRTSSSVNFSPCRPTVPIAPAGLPYNPAPMPQFIMTSTGQLLPLASTFGPFPSAPSNCHPSPQLVYLQHPAAPQPAPQLTSPTLNAEADDVFKRKKKRKQQPPQGTNQLQPQQATSIAISQAQPQHSFVQLGSATGQTHPQAGGFMSFPGTPFVLMSSSAPHNKLVISPAGNLVATPTSQPQTTMTQCQSQGPFIQNFIGSHFPAATVQNGTILLGPPNFPFFNPVPNGTFITTSSTAAPQQQTSGCMDSPHGISQSNASVSSQAEQHQSQSGVLLSPKTSTTNMSSSPTGPNLLPLIRPAAPPGPVFLQAAPPRFFTPGTPCPPQFVITTPSPNGTPTLISPIPSSSKSPSVKDPSTPLLVATSPVPISTGNAMLLSPTHRTSVSPSCARKRKHSNVQGGGQAGEPSAKCAKALIPSSDKELLVTNEGTTVIPEHPVSLTQTNPAVA